MKHTPMKRSSKPMKRTPIKPRSDRRAQHMAESRIPKLEEALAARRSCEVCPRIELGARAVVAAANLLARLGGHPPSGFVSTGLTHCAHRIQGLHERRKSSSGGSRENDANLIPACNWGNGWIEDHPAAARAVPGLPTLVVREGDPEWEALSRRNDRYLNGL